MRLPTPLLRRNKSSHKNTYGHVLVIAGSPSMLGAACLVSLASLRSGAGLVTAAIPKSLNLCLQKKLDHSVMSLPVVQSASRAFTCASLRQILPFLAHCNAVALGPGLGSGRSTGKFVVKFLKSCPLPVVVDADALNFLCGELDLFLETPAVRILTPHPGEFFRLTGTKPVSDRDRLKAAINFAKKYRVILVLKGYHTIVADANGVVHVNRTGNPGLAKAGMGDVLTGMIAGILSQGVDPFTSAKFAVYLHGKSADMSIRRIAKASLLPGDIIDMAAKLLRRERVK